MKSYAAVIAIASSALVLTAGSFENTSFKNQENIKVSRDKRSRLGTQKQGPMAPLTKEWGEKDKAPPSGKDIVKPAKGVAKVKPIKPTWCKRTPREIENSTLSSYLSWSRALAQRIRKEAEQNSGIISWTNLKYLADSACVRPKDSVRQQWVAQGRQYVLNHLAISDAGLQSLFRYLSRTESTGDDRKKICKAWRDKKASSVDKSMQLAAMRTLLRCDHQEADRHPWNEILRREKPKNEVIRGALLYSALNPFVARMHADKRDLMAPVAASRFVLANQDYAGWSEKKLLANLKSEKASAVEAAHILYTYAHTLQHMKGRVAAYQKAASKTPELKRILFTAPTKGFKDYVKGYKKAKKQVDVALKYESLFFTKKQSKKALASAFSGCQKELRKALADYIRSEKPKSLEDTIRVTSNNFGYSISTALAACEGIVGNKNGLVMASFMRGQVLSEGLPVFGPRDAAVSAGAYALAEVLSDQESFPIKRTNGFRVDHWAHKPVWNKAAWKRVNADVVFPTTGGWSKPGEKIDTSKATGDAQVKSVKTKGDNLVISFKTVRWKRPVYSCKSTGRISRIDAQGNVHYHEICKKVRMENMSLTMPTMVTPKVLAPPGIKKGSMVRMYTGPGDNNTRFGLILEVYKDMDKKKIVSSLATKL